MSDKGKSKKPEPKPENPADKKTSETVHLSAEELRKISGGAATHPPPQSRRGTDRPNTCREDRRRFPRGPKPPSRQSPPDSPSRRLGGVFYRHVIALGPHRASHEAVPVGAGRPTIVMASGSRGIRRAPGPQSRGLGRVALLAASIGEVVRVRCP